MSSLLLHQRGLLSVSKCVTLTNWQSVRFRLRHKRKEPLRKPIWQPTAPSKLYRIKKKPEYSPTEQAQRDHLDYTYDINMKSIKHFLRKEFYLPTVESESRPAKTVLDDSEEQARLIKENEEDNRRIAGMREERLAEFKADMNAELMMMSMKEEEEKRRIGEQFDVLVRQEIERSKTYITRENLDDKIEEALTHSTNYEFAIDTSGKVHFEGSLHPYAFKPKDIPDTSSNVDEYDKDGKQKTVVLKPTRLI